MKTEQWDNMKIKFIKFSFKGRCCQPYGIYVYCSKMILIEKNITIFWKIYTLIHELIHHIIYKVTKDNHRISDFYLDYLDVLLTFNTECNRKKVINQYRKDKICLF